MLRIGVVNLDVSHPKAFSEYLRQGSRARYTAVYNDGFRGDDEVEAFMKNNGIAKRASSVAELAAEVDIGFVQGCDWDRHLRFAELFLRAGKPVFIDKPIVGNLRDCLALEALAREGAVIYGSSSLRYADEVTAIAGLPAEERGEIVHVTATVGVDEFNYAIHAVETVMGFLGPCAKGVSTAFLGREESHGAVLESYRVRFADGAAAEYHINLSSWQPSTATVMTTKTTYCVSIDAGKAYGTMLDAVCDAAEGKGNRLAPVESLTESIKIMLAGRLSKQKLGAPVLLCELPLADPGFNGGLFAEGYAASAKKIYTA